MFFVKAMAMLKEEVEHSSKTFFSKPILKFGKNKLGRLDLDESVSKCQTDWRVTPKLQNYVICNNYAIKRNL